MQQKYHKYLEHMLPREDIYIMVRELLVHKSIFGGGINSEIFWEIYNDLNTTLGLKPTEDIIKFYIVQGVADEIAGSEIFDRLNGVSDEDISERTFECLVHGLSNHKAAEEMRDILNELPVW